MAYAARVPAALRHLTSPCLTRSFRAAQHQQRRWAQVHDVRFLATTQESRSVLEKYRDKLDRKAKEEGLPDIDSLKKAYSDKIEKLRKEADVVVPPRPPTAPSSTSSSTPESSAPSSPASTAPSTPPSSPSPTKSETQKESSSGIKPLSSYLDLEKATTLPVRELTAVWRLRHASSPLNLSAVIPTETYTQMDSLARTHPQFVLPVPHPDQGAEMHFLQWTWDPATKTSTVLFTQLAEYKARGEFAQPHTTVTHHLDFAGDKGVVLMQGQVVENRGVKPEDAQWLLMCLQRFYGAADAGGADKVRVEARRNLLEWFAKGDSRFTVEALLEEAERVG